MVQYRHSHMVTPLPTPLPYISMDMHCMYTENLARKCTMTKQENAVIIQFNVH